MRRARKFGRRTSERGGLLRYLDAIDDDIAAASGGQLMMLAESHLRRFASSSGTRRLEAASPWRTSDFEEPDIWSDPTCIESDDVFFRCLACRCPNSSAQNGLSSARSVGQLGAISGLAGPPITSKRDQSASPSNRGSTRYPWAFLHDNGGSCQVQRAKRPGEAKMLRAIQFSMRKSPRHLAVTRHRRTQQNGGESLFFTNNRKGGQRCGSC